jgi:hypothetical protein
MKLRVFVLILALSFVVWAQGTPSSPNATPAPEAKSCCHHMDQAKEGEGCCHHAKAEGKDAMACCGKDKCEMKDAKSCCGGEGKDMKACMQQCKKGKRSCGGSASEKTATNCCGKSCSRHEHAPAAS